MEGPTNYKKHLALAHGKRRRRPCHPYDYAELVVHPRPGVGEEHGGVQFRVHRQMGHCLLIHCCRYSQAGQRWRSYGT